MRKVIDKNEMLDYISSHTIQQLLVDVQNMDMLQKAIKYGINITMPLLEYIIPIGIDNESTYKFYPITILGYRKVTENDKNYLLLNIKEFGEEEIKCPYTEIKMSGYDSFLIADKESYCLFFAKQSIGSNDEILDITKEIISGLRIDSLNRLSYLVTGILSKMIKEIKEGK